MANTPQQTTGIAQEYSYAYQGAGGQWVMTKEEFEGPLSGLKATKLCDI